MEQTLSTLSTYATVKSVTRLTDSSRLNSFFSSIRFPSSCSASHLFCSLREHVTAENKSEDDHLCATCTLEHCVILLAVHLYLCSTPPARSGHCLLCAISFRHSFGVFAAKTLISLSRTTLLGGTLVSLAGAAVCAACAVLLRTPRRQLPLRSCRRIHALPA